MKETKTEFLGYDNDKSVFIDEELLINEVDNGLDRALEITDSLVTEANEIMSSVSDIISLAPLSMEECVDNVMRGKSYIYDYVLGNLYNLDAVRESALVGVLGNLKLVHDYLRSVDITFKDKASIEGFKPIDAFALSGFGEFQRKEDLISEKTLACLKPEEENLSPSAAKNIFDIGLGIALGVKDYGVDLLQGIGLMLQARSNPMIIANEMRPLAQSIALDPKGTWNNITQSITDSFKDNMINGDYTSQARYSTYMLLSVADIFFLVRTVQAQ